MRLFLVAIAVFAMLAAIWRSLRIPAAVTVVHDVLQTAFGWLEELPPARVSHPERFDLAVVNRKLAMLSKRVARWR